MLGWVNVLPWFTRNGGAYGMVRSICISRGRAKVATNASTAPVISSVTPAEDGNGKVLLKNLTLGEMEDWVENDLGHQRFRARQLWEWIYSRSKLAASFEEMTDLAKSFREKLGEVAQIDSISLGELHTSKDGTRKLTFRLESGGNIESVLIPAEGRTTLCISSQHGCALNCQFCFTGRMGLRRHLSQAEIVDQVVMTQRLFGNEYRISNIVFMGEGEPLHNIDNVIRALDVILHGRGLNFSHNKVTVSTSGLVPEMRRFVRQSRANLAVSLHATNNEVRSWIMPINRKHPLEELVSALREDFPREHARQQKVFFEYLMLRGVNDSLTDAKELLRLVAQVPCKVNLIRFNSHEGTEFQGSEESTILAFQDYLVKKGMTVTVRQSRGDDLMMACGQLGELGGVSPPRMKPPTRFQPSLRQVGSQPQS
uniref:Radical SAM core domain-containing protein n=1 Tax=Compsopogon caeruleus TaxID=31354 RepID=A0A7S1T9K8_9RHOD|mmetsp:Transcript_13639/g.27931  ORF Transcript_13639/g.27931 Transcript_13639/m.27931 type:complete len:426 (+) Transcript_13639:75-1352(+)